jgi:hypothetical protein
MKLVYGRASVVAETLRLKKRQLTEQMAIFRPIEAPYALASLHVTLKARHMTPHQLFEWFLERDSDGSGTMEAEEFRHAIVNELGLGLTEPQVDELARALDRDANGNVCYNEILSALDFDANKEGKERRQAIEKQADALRRSESAPLLMSRPPAASTFSKSLKYQPMSVPPPKPAPVPEGGGRYATPAEAHRLWYGPNNRLRPMSSGATFRSRSSHPPKILYKRHTKPRTQVDRPTFLNHSAKTLPATNFFSGMLGQKSLLERTMKFENRSRTLSQASALPAAAPTLPMQGTTEDLRRYGDSEKGSIVKPSSFRGKSSYTRPKSQEKIGRRRTGRNEMVRASTAPAIKIQSQSSKISY